MWAVSKIADQRRWHIEMPSLEEAEKWCIDHPEYEYFRLCF